MSAPFVINVGADVQASIGRYVSQAARAASESPQVTAPALRIASGS